MRYRSFVTLFALLCTGLLMRAQLAVEPSANPASIQFNSVLQYRINISFDSVAADGYIVLKSTNPIVVNLSDGIVYQTGQGLSGCKVVSFGASRNINVREVYENTTYYFAVYAYNGSGTTINYRQLNPAIASITTPASDPLNYYSGIDSSDWDFLSKLTARINPHTQIAYSNYRNTMIPVLYERDTVGGAMVVNCEYSGEVTVYQPPFTFQIPGANYNREHVFPQSWMPVGGNTNSIQGSDFYNLLLTRSTPNQQRSNNPMGIVLTTTTSYGQAKLGLNALGKLVFEPKDEAKGDAARAIFYEMVCYNGVGGFNWGFDYLPTLGPQQDASVLKLWHLQDPPDKFERTKNAYIASLQNNRNPFIDHPGWVDCINFDSLFKTINCGPVSSISDIHEYQFQIYPNPASGYANIEINFPVNFTLPYTISDLSGRTVLTGIIDDNFTHIDLAGINTGTYIFYLQNGIERFTRKLSVWN